MAEERYNRRNPAVKRILQEVKEMQSNPSDDFISLPLEENIFEWQFAIRGPRDTEFEGGIFHGRIQLPADYPLKPPAFLMLTPNGRFETQTKICLSISNYHPEHWQPSWSVRTALVALIAFMPTNPDGALGSLDYKKEERRSLAIKSREAPPKYGSPERQKLIDEIHQHMLSKAPPVPGIPSAPTTDEHSNNVANEETRVSPEADVAPEDRPDAELEQRGMEDMHEAHADAAAGPTRVSLHAEVSLSTTETGEPSQRTAAKVGKPVDDRLFTWAALGLTIAIVVLIVKKVLKSSGISGYTELF